MSDGDKPLDLTAHGQLASPPDALPIDPLPIAPLPIEPLPIALVDELERLTRDRARFLPGEPPPVIERRRKRIDDLVADLKARRQPVRGDVVLGVRLERISGRGNVGALWQGVDVATGEARAVRLFDTYLLGKSLALHHFRRGLSATVELGRDPRCPRSILKIHRVDGPRLVAVMDWLPGGNLGDLKQRSLSRAGKLEVFRAVCGALKFAHERAVIHRDLKPANILFDTAGKPRVTDFDMTDPRLLKRIASPTGIPSVFTAPEERLGSTEREITSDIFSLGRLLQFLLVGHDPIDAEEAVPRLAELIGQPQGLIRIIRKCTMRDPNLRYPSIADLIEDLGEHEERPGAVGAGAPSAEGVERAPHAVRLVAPRPVERAPGRGWRVAAIVAGAALVVASIAALRFHGCEPHPGAPIEVVRSPSSPGAAASPPVSGAESPRPSGSSRSTSDPAPLDLALPSSLPTGMALVSITGAPDGNAEGAMVFLDGANGGAVPCDLPVTAGAHQIEVKRNGFKDFSQALSVAAGDHTAVEVRLDPESHPGSISILGENLRGAEIYVDGTLRGVAPGHIDSLEEGDHLVEVRLGMAIPWQKTVHVAPSVDTLVEVKFTYYPR